MASQHSNRAAAEMPVTRSETFASLAVAWFRHHEFPPVTVFDPREDRCLIAWTPELEEAIEKSPLLARWTFKIKAHRPYGIVSAVKGWREKVATWAVQIIQHDIGGMFRFFEVDVDPHNPERGLALIILHTKDCLKEMFTGRKVDPSRVAKVFRKRGIGIDG